MLDFSLQVSEPNRWPISVDQQQGIFNELSRIDVIIFKNKKLFISILNIYFHVIRTREWRI